MENNEQLINPDRFLSHSGSELETIEQTAKKARERINSHKKASAETKQYLCSLLDQLLEFPFGRFMLQNRGMDGFWSDYMIHHPRVGRKTGKDESGRTLTRLEKVVLDKFPNIIATQERHEIFGKIIQDNMKNGASMASLPCGMMREFLERDFTGIDQIEMIGIDIDQRMLDGGEKLAKEYGVADKVKFTREDAWELPFEDEFSLLASSGLSIYEPSDDKVVDLYRQFYKSLRPDGVLVTSFMNFPPLPGRADQWEVSGLDQEILQIQGDLFVKVIGANFTAYRSKDTVREQLEEAGFSNIQFFFDTYHLFPTVTAEKKVGS